MEFKDVEKFLNPWINDVKIYGTDDIEFITERPEIARMFVNENPILPSEEIVNAITKAAREGNRYPDRGHKICAKVANLFDLKPENVYLSSGSSEMLDMMCRLFLSVGDEMITPHPTFSLYEVRASNVGAKTVKIPMTLGDMEYDTKGFLDAANEKTKLIVVCNPNNPTGNFISHEDLLKILDLGIPTLIDEAYLEYAPDHKSKAFLIKDYPHAFVSHTFSKAYGLAGMRCGFTLAHEELVKVFRKVQMPWNISRLSMAALEAAVDNREELQKKVLHNQKEVDFYMEELGSLEGVRPYFSHGNYMLVDCTDAGVVAKELVNYLLDEGFMIKAFPVVHGRQGFIRISIGSREENEKCAAAIKKYFKENH